MLVDGKAIRDSIKAELKEAIVSLGRTPVLSLVWVGDDPVTGRFVELKKRFGKEIGAQVDIVRFDSNVAEEVLIERVAELADDESVDGIVVQLPLPSSIATDRVLDAIPVGKDVDVLSSAAYACFEDDADAPLPPVAGAVREIFTRHNIEVKGKYAAVIGKGRLVGAPVAAWLDRKGAFVTVAEKGDDLADLLMPADIIVTGAGDPHVVAPEMVHEGAAVIDAGTSDAGGILKGDVDPRVAEKASLLSPVPGGVGPITIACLFKNLIFLLKEGIST